MLFLNIPDQFRVVIGPRDSKVDKKRATVFNMQPEKYLMLTLSKDSLIFQFSLSCTTSRIINRNDQIDQEQLKLALVVLG